MNCSNHRVWALLAMSLGAVASASAQGVPFFQDFERICDDPSTTTSNFSANYNIVRHRTDLFAYTIGTSGTVRFETCFAPNGFTADVPGRIGFAIGRVGSIQDEAIEGQAIDDDLQLTLGMPWGPGGNWGYAKIITTAVDTGARTFGNFGEGAMDGFFTGASDRYSVCIDRVNNVETVLRVDCIGDAARLNWQFENLDANQRGIGLWFGQYVIGLGPTTNGGIFTGAAQGMEYVRAPGLKPLLLNTRFARNPNPAATPRQNPMPDTVDFGLSQSWNYGLQIRNAPTTGANSAFADQTQVDQLEIGDAGALQIPSLLGPQGVAIAADNSRPMSDTYFFPFEDVSFVGTIPGLSGSGYIQKFEPLVVGGSASPSRFRTIVSYYKSTTGQSDYAQPYAAVVDAPRTVAVRDANPNQFNPSVATVRVYIDNTRGFATINQAIPLNDVRITLSLPEGITDATNPTRRTIVRTIDRVDPNDARLLDPANPFQFVDFQVVIAPYVSGTQYYTVTIEPKPGATKTIRGQIDVASQPRLTINRQANLVTAPWRFSATNWDSILGGSLTADVDYQAFTWDPQRQEYVVQVSPQRGRGTFLVSNIDAGNIQLGGNPQTPNDLATGAPLIELQSGWNLIANPYNYPIEVGQIVGVTATNPTRSFTYQELAEQGIISSSLASWDSNTQSYKFTEGFADQILPNRGYWIFVSTTQPVTLSFPPVFLPFIPRGTGGIQNAGGWSLNMVARTAKAMDDQNYVGTALTQSRADLLRVQEPPIAPVRNAIRAAIQEGQSLLARSIKVKSNKLEWKFVVTPRTTELVTLTWPNSDQIPTNFNLKLVDETTGASYNMRSNPRFEYYGTANQTRSFKIIAEDTASTSLINSVTASANASRATINYVLGASGISNTRILQSGRLIATLTRNRVEAAGSKTLTWNLLDAANRRVRAGVYAAEVKITSNGRTETKTVTFLVR